MCSTHAINPLYPTRHKCTVNMLWSVCVELTTTNTHTIEEQALQAHMQVIFLKSTHRKPSIFFDNNQLGRLNCFDPEHNYCILILTIGRKWMWVLYHYSSGCWTVTRWKQNVQTMHGRQLARRWVRISIAVRILVLFIFGLLRERVQYNNSADTDFLVTRFVLFAKKVWLP